MVRHTSGLKKVAREVVLEVPEPYDGYHEQLPRKLAEVIGCQGSGLTKIVRGREVRRILEAFGQQVAAQTEKTEEV